MVKPCDPPEQLSLASPDRPACQKCSLFGHCKTPFSLPFIPKGWTRKLLIVGEAFGEHEDEESHRPFTGPAGKLLRGLWKSAGFTDLDVALVNAVRCRPRKNATPSMLQVRACRPFLLRVVDTLKPEMVIGVGGTALRALTNKGSANVTKSRGRNLTIPGYTGEVRVFCTYHPAAVLRGATHLRKEILDDLKRDWEMVAHPEEREPTSHSLGIDTEWDRGGVLLTIGFADDISAIAYDKEVNPEWLSNARSALALATTLTGHSLPGDLEALAKAGLPLRSTWITGTSCQDSLLLSRMADENRLSYELETLLLSSISTEPWKQESTPLLQKLKDMKLISPGIRQKRCRLDAWAARKIAANEYNKLDSDLVRFTTRVAFTLHRLSMAGACVDLSRFREMADAVNLEAAKYGDLLRRAAAGVGMVDFSPTNDHHIRELLYDRLELPVLSRTGKARLPSVAKLTLKQLDHPVAKLLVEYSIWDKIKSVSVDGLSKLIAPASIAHGILDFHFNPLGARTGRRSSNKPNSQNWPKSVRRIICSRWPGGLVGEFDYRKLEPRIIAWLAKDDKLLAAFTGGRGYIDIAHELLGYTVQDGTPEYRAVKCIVLGVHYNMQTPKMAKDLRNMGVKFSEDYEAHEKETDRLRKLYLRRYPGLGRYMEGQESMLLAHNFVPSLLGRRRRLPLVDGTYTKGYGHMLNQAINFPVQSLASDVTGSALVDCEAALLDDYGIDYIEFFNLLIEYRRKLLTNPRECAIILPQLPISLLFNEVHDSLLLDIHPDFVKRHTELMVETMRAVPTLRKLAPTFSCPLDVDVKMGLHWGESDGGKN